MHAMFEKSISQNLSIFFLGLSPEKLMESERYLRGHYPVLRIAELISQPFQPLSFEDAGLEWIFRL